MPGTPTASKITSGLRPSTRRQVSRPARRRGSETSSRPWPPPGNAPRERVRATIVLDPGRPQGCDDRQSHRSASQHHCGVARPDAGTVHGVQLTAIGSVERGEVRLEPFGTLRATCPPGRGTRRTRRDTHRSTRPCRGLTRRRRRAATRSRHRLAQFPLPSPSSTTSATNSWPNTTSRPKSVMAGGSATVPRHPRRGLAHLGAELVGVVQRVEGPSRRSRRPACGRAPGRGGAQVRHVIVDQLTVPHDHGTHGFPSLVARLTGPIVLGPGHRRSGRDRVTCSRGIRPAVSWAVVRPAHLARPGENTGSLPNRFLSGRALPRGRLKSPRFVGGRCRALDVAATGGSPQALASCRCGSSPCARRAPRRSGI